LRDTFSAIVSLSIRMTQLFWSSGLPVSFVYAQSTVLQTSGIETAGPWPVIF
jgi:hypothetical protein